MRKTGNYRKADDISRCANCKHHYKDLAAATGISYDYARKILLGLRDAEDRRAQMTEYLLSYEGGYDEAV